MAAAPITGVANIAGNVTVSASSILFSPTFMSTAGAQETGSFSGLTGGTIQSLTGGATTGVVNIPNFIDFSNGTAVPVIFDLTYIAPGVGTQAGCSSAALGTECTPTGSPFTLFQLTSNTVVATLQFSGQSYTGSAATGTTPTTAIFSTQTVVAGTVPQIYAMLASGQSLNAITYSASFATSNQVPEPASLSLLGIGFLSVGAFSRRLFRSK